MRLIKSPQLDRFRCIAADCPDSCCKEWDVQVDPETAAMYRALPGALGDRLRQVLADADGETVMTIENGRCPMWRTDGLCRIQAELGEAALCKTCRDFPRLTHDYGDFIEMDLELSCPEAARLLLTTAPEEPIIKEIPGGSAPEYDREAMDSLLRTRHEALALLERPQLGEALALLLIYSHHAQAQLDGEDAADFDADAALETARQLATSTDPDGLIGFFQNLEILTENWRSRLAAPSPASWSEPVRALARYGIRRYWLQAVSDYDLISRAKLTVVSCLLIKRLGGDIIATAQLYSKEIENDADNVDAILDAAYTHPAFTDDKLLGMLL